LAEPIQGWEQWAKDIEDIVAVCESESAIGLVQSRHRELLTALSRERNDLYRQLGESIGARREAFRERRAPRSHRRQSRTASSGALLQADHQEKEDA
jgi:hypothetical protein